MRSNLGGYIRNLFRWNSTSIVPSSIPLPLHGETIERLVTTIQRHNVGPGVHIASTIALPAGTKLLEDLGLIQPKFTRDIHGFDIPSRAPELSIPRINARRFWLNTLNERVDGYRDRYDSILKQISGYSEEAMPFLSQGIKENLEGIYILAAIVPLPILQKLHTESRTDPAIIPAFRNKLQESKNNLTAQDCNSLIDLYKNNKDAFSSYQVNVRSLAL